MITKGEVVEGKYAKKLIAYYVNPCLSYHYVYIGEKELSLLVTEYSGIRLLSIYRVIF